MELSNFSPEQLWTAAFVIVTFAVYLYIGWSTRVRETSGFYVAGRGVPAIANGAATAADWMSAASFISMAGLISTLGYDGSMYLMGWTGGYVLLALLLAPYLREVRKIHRPGFCRRSVLLSNRPCRRSHRRNLYIHYLRGRPNARRRHCF